MWTQPFVSFAPGVQQSGVGHLYYALHERYVDKVKKIRCKVHLQKVIKSSAGKFDRDDSFPVIREETIERLYSYPELQGRVILAVPCVLRDNNTYVRAVEFDMGDEILFVLKRSGTYTNPYRPQEKIVTEAMIAEVDIPPEESADERNRSDAFIRLVEKVLKETESKNEKQKQATEELDLREFVVPPTSPFVFFPKDKETPLVPFWFSYKQWQYFDARFEITDGGIVLARQALLDTPASIYDLFLFTSPESIEFEEPKKPSMVSARNQALQAEFAQERFEELYNYITRMSYQALKQLSPERSQLHYYKIDKGQMYGCVRLDKPGPVQCPLINLKALQDRYRVLPLTKPTYGKVIFYVQKGEVVGVEAVKLGSKEAPSLIWGTNKPVTYAWDDYQTNLNYMDRYLGNKFDHLNDSQIDALQTSTSALAKDAAHELPVTIEIGEDLTKIINHPLIYGDMIYSLGTTSLDEENVMYGIEEASGLEFTNHIARESNALDLVFQ